MPRKLRVEYPGAMYHVMSRGDQRDDIFRSDWCLGAEAFRKECLKLILGKPKGAKSNLHKWMKGPPDDASQPKLEME